nr:hypothetical protein [Tanacetum cinerariifolium]
MIVFSDEVEDDEDYGNDGHDNSSSGVMLRWLPNDIYSLIDSNETAKDLWDALERQMRGSEYGKQDKKATILYKYETFKAFEGEQLLDTYLRYLQVINDLKKCGYKKDNCDVNDALGYKKKAVVVTSDPLTLVAEKTKSANKKQEFVKSNDKKEDKKADENKGEMSKVKCYNCKEGHFAKDCKKAKVKDHNYYKTKMLLAKKDSDEQVLLAEDQAWMESSSDSDQEINANMVFMDQIEKVLSESDEKYYDNSTNYGLFVNSDDNQEISHDAIESASENFIENHIDSQKDYDKSKVDHNDSEEKKHLVDKLIQKFNHAIAKLNTFEEQNNEFNEQIKVLNEKNADLLAQTEVLQDQLKVKHVVIDTHTECQAQYAKLEEERYEYMIRYSALCDNDKQHRKKIDEQEILFDKTSHQLVKMNNNVLRQTNQTIHMIMPSKDTFYTGKKGIGFENPSYFKKANDLRHSLYDEKVIGLGHTLMFLIHSDEALEIEKFKRERENKIEFAYDYGNLNAKKILIDLEYEVVSLLEKAKANLKTIESLKSKGFESSENAISKSENQSENDCQVVEIECDNVENPKVIAPGMFKLSVSQSVSPMSMSKTSCDSKNVEKTSGAYVCNDAMNVSCNSRMCDLFNENNLFIFDDESVRISPVSKMPFRKKPRDSMNMRSKNNSNKSLPRTVHRWLLKMQPLAEPVAK